MSLPIKSQQSSLGQVPIQAFDVELELERCRTILKREIANLMAESGKGKLRAGYAKDLVSYFKLLDEIRLTELKELGTLSTDELRKLIGKE